MYKCLRSCDSALPRIYGLPKIHKTNLPLRPIVSFIGSATYEMPKFLKNVLSPLVGNSVHAVKNSNEFIKMIEPVRINQFESEVSFDVVVCSLQYHLKQLELLCLIDSATTAH